MQLCVYSLLDFFTCDYTQKQHTSECKRKINKTKTAFFKWEVEKQPTSRFHKRSNAQQAAEKSQTTGSPVLTTTATLKPPRSPHRPQTAEVHPPLGAHPPHQSPSRSPAQAPGPRKDDDVPAPELSAPGVLPAEPPWRSGYPPRQTPLPARQGAVKPAGRGAG